MKTSNPYQLLLKYVFFLFNYFLRQLNSLLLLFQEEKEIHRVFELLCGYQQKVRIKEEVKDLTAWLSVNKSRVLSQINSGLVIDEQKVIASNLAASNRLDELNKELQDLESKPDKKITAVDVIEMFKFLKEKVSRKEVEDMIWEVDENLDECVDWQEFRLMFNRNIMDRSGLEPSRLVRSRKNSLYSLCTVTITFFYLSHYHSSISHNF